MTRKGMFKEAGFSECVKVLRIVVSVHFGLSIAGAVKLPYTYLNYLPHAGCASKPIQSCIECPVPGHGAV